MPFSVGDDLDTARAEGELEGATLRLRLVQIGGEDRLSFKFNGAALRAQPRNTRTFYGGLVDYSAARSGRDARIDTHYWYEFDLPIELVRRGGNSVEVCLEEKLAERVEDRVLHQVELLLEYAQAPETVAGQM